MILRANENHKNFIIKSQIDMALESEGLELNIKTVTKGVSYIFNEPQTGFYLIKEIDSQPVACLLVLKEWSDWRAGNVLWIHSVYVQKEYRRKGIFREMYHYLKDSVLEDDSLKGLRLYVEKENLKAIKTYESIGMSREHYHMYEWLKS